MRKLSVILIWLASACLVFLEQACQSHDPRAGGREVTINVNLGNTLGLKWVYLKELDIKDVRIVDSVDVSQSGKISFHVKTAQAGFYLIETRPNAFITLQVEPGETIDIEADAQKLKNEYQIKGSPGSALVYDYLQHSRVNLMKIDSLKMIFEKARNSDDFPHIRIELDSAYQRIFRDQKDYLRLLIGRNPRSLASLFILNQHFGPNLVLTEKDDFDCFVKLDTALMRIYPTNKHAIDHHERVTTHQRELTEKTLAEARLAIGQPAPDIRLKTLDEKEYSLSSCKGKTVLLMFWQALCGKCRQDHRALHDFYEQNKHKGLVVFAVSVDNNKDLWKAAIKVDKAEWIQLGDLKGVNSPVYKLYDLDKDLPLYYIISKEGKIVTRGRRFAEMENELKSRL
jgi:peroxiredoxin